jgi:hypothetical protein
MATVNIKPTTYRYPIPDAEPESSKIISVSQKISQCIRLPDLFNVVLECALDCSGAQKGIILSIEEGNAWVRSKATKERNNGIFVQALPKSNLSIFRQDDISTAIIQHVIEVGKEIIINNPNILNTNCNQNTYCSQPAWIIAFPIIIESKTIAIIYLENSNPQQPFSTDIISMLSVICKQAAISFQNVHHFDLLGEKVIKQMKKVHKIKKEIETNNCSRTDYLRFIDDAIRSKIGDVIGFSNLIQSREKTSPLNKETRHYLTHIRNSTLELSEFLKNASVFSTPFTTEKPKLYEALNLKPLIHSIIQSNRDSAAKNSVAFNFNFKEPLPKIIYSDRGLVNWILMTVISRTIQLSHHNDIVNLTVSATAKDFKIAIARKQARPKNKGITNQMPTKVRQIAFSHGDPLPEKPVDEPSLRGVFDFIDLDMIKNALKLLKGKLTTTTKKHNSSLTVTIPINETLANTPQPRKQSCQVGKTLRKMPQSLANELLLDFKVLQSTPIYKGGTLYRIIQKAKLACEGYNSKYPAVLDNVITAVFVGDTLVLNRLITKLLAIHQQETARQ